MLDEVEESDLREEINLRVKRRRNGLCDYCGRKPTTSTCKFPERHALPLVQVREFDAGV